MILQYVSVWHICIGLYCLTPGQTIRTKTLFFTFCQCCMVFHTGFCACMQLCFLTECQRWVCSTREQPTLFYLLYRCTGKGECGTREKGIPDQYMVRPRRASYGFECGGWQYRLEAWEGILHAHQTFSVTMVDGRPRPPLFNLLSQSVQQRSTRQVSTTIGDQLSNLS